MKLDVFAGQEISELSMIEVARAILEERGRDNDMYFSDLVNEIQNYLGKSDADIRYALPFFTLISIQMVALFHLVKINGVYVHGMLLMRLMRKSSP
ncbi:DNA-directed RNA polymerase subunit delta [Streptococcus equi subsp. equi]|nr:DNA-directed RNA polymerase subunit delta [Streptococcus equi subsp. equi]